MKYRQTLFMQRGMVATDKVFDLPFLDITGPETEVQVEYDKARGVLYVHLEGATVLRICRIEKGVKLVNGIYSFLEDK